MVKKKQYSTANQEHEITRDYISQEIELKWQKEWKDKGTFSPNLDTSINPFYNLMMFPYPSAEGMHVGNMYAFTGSDIYGRFMRMNGYTVFEPIGLDGFGIHSENYAIKVGIHPKQQAKKSEYNFYRQLRAIGNAFDWTRTVETYNPEYYKWTQWIFIQLYKAGLAYRKKAPVNFCPSDKTVLADEQVIEGRCERCGAVVEKKELEQWFFSITKYADKLLDGLTKIDWSEKVKIAQHNWIGKSEGAEVVFEIKNLKQKIAVFTTRIDTIFGATFIVISPFHPSISSILKSPVITDKKKEEIKEYVHNAQEKTEKERHLLKAKTGLFTDIYAVNPVNGKEIPVWISDYVLMEYGTGAIMAVPSHDTRDLEFARKYNLPIIPVIRKKKTVIASYLIGSIQITDSDLTKIGVKIVERLANDVRKIIIPVKAIAEYEKLIGEKLTSGYWNEYIDNEAIFLFKHNDGHIKRIVLTSETEAKVRELMGDFLKKSDKEIQPWSVLMSNEWYASSFIHTEYGFLINSDTYNGLSTQEAKKAILDTLTKQNIAKKVKIYHLRDWLISRQRYWGPPIPMIKCNQCGWIPVAEKDLPVLLPDIEDWKPKGTGESPLANLPSFVNTICPKCKGKAKRETDVSDTFLDSAWYFFRYTSTEEMNAPWKSERIKKWLPVNMYIGGAEHSVLHLLYTRFLTKVFKDLGIISFDEPFPRFFAHGLLIKEGAKMSKSKGNVVIPDSYIKKYGADTLRTYLMFIGPFNAGGDFYDTGIEGIYRFLKRIWALISNKNGSIAIESLNEERIYMMNKTIQRVTEAIKTFRYNVAIAGVMEYSNYLSKHESLSDNEKEVVLLLLSPFSPHITEELWRILGKPFSIHQHAWPEFNNKYLQLSEYPLVIQINGKMRDLIHVSKDIISQQPNIEKMALERGKIHKFLAGKKIKKVIYIKGKIVNFVV